MKLGTTWAAAILILAALGGVNPLPAQPPVPGGLGGTRPPALSPYLNLARQGGSPGLNYYGLVRPQQQFQQSVLDLRGAVNANQQIIGNFQNDPNGLSPTGHGSGFMNYNSYFMNTGQLNTNQGFGAAGAQQARFTNQNIRTPQPGLTGVNPGGAPGGGIRRR